MRVESERKIHVRDVVIGGPRLLICLPLVAKDRPSLLSQADELAALNPDLLEWRIDGYDDVNDLTESLDALKALRSRIGSVPLIFTCRIETEGGLAELPSQFRQELIEVAIRSGHVDIVDVEMCNPSAFIDSVKKVAQAHNTRLILSYHDFERTPDAETICDKLTEAQTLGADIAKVAVMPHGCGDVLTLFNAIYSARTGGLRIPMATMAMERVGGISRIAGGLFGSDITFAMGKEASAPGQIPIDRLRQAMKVIYS